MPSKVLTARFWCSHHSNTHWLESAPRLLRGVTTMLLLTATLLLRSEQRCLTFFKTLIGTALFSLTLSVLRMELRLLRPTLSYGLPLLCPLKFMIRQTTAFAVWVKFISS